MTEVVAPALVWILVWFAFDLALGEWFCWYRRDVIITEQFIVALNPEY